MNRIENLPEITDRALDGLRADERLKSRIVSNAFSKKESPFNQIRHFRFVPVILSAVAVMILCVVFLNGKKPVVDTDHHLIHSFAAGSSESGSVAFESFLAMDPSEVESMGLVSVGKADGSDNMILLINALKNDSVCVTDINVTPDDQLDIRTVSGRIISIPVKSPYTIWADGIRKCDIFFELLDNPAD